MTEHLSIWSSILHAGLVVKSVMLILLGASVFSWAIILHRSKSIKLTISHMQQFEKSFYSGMTIQALYDQCKRQRQPCPTTILFIHAYQEYLTQTSHAKTNPISWMRHMERVMDIRIEDTLQSLSNQNNWLATIGSTSPYVGLFGTVWGIMTAFQALGGVQSATIAMVAPGISEALVATAIGLFAAIPAVVAYNAFSDRINQVDFQLQQIKNQLITQFTRVNDSQYTRKQTPAKETVTESNTITQNVGWAEG